jgi:hypothetical protein
VTSTGSPKGVYSCLETSAQQVANESKLGSSWHHHYESSVVRVRLWGYGICSAFIPLMHLSWLSLGFSSLGGLRARLSFLQLIWPLCVWVIWNERNHRLFRDSTMSLPQMLDKVKLHSYLWLKTTNAILLSNYHSWWSSPFSCLGID